MYCVYAHDALIGHHVTMEHNIYTFIVLSEKQPYIRKVYMQLPQDWSYL